VVESVYIVCEVMDIVEEKGGGDEVVEEEAGHE